MKKIILLLFALGLNAITNAQSFNATTIGTNPKQAYDIIKLDIDNDGDLDIATSYKQNDALVFKLNDGNGNFGTAQPIEGPVATQGIKLCVADVNNDGYPGIGVVFRSSNIIAYYPNNNGIFGEMVFIANQSAPRDIDADDMDNDGDVDLIVGDFYGNLIFYENDGNGNFTQHALPTTDDIKIIKIYDINHDDNPDIFVGHGHNYNRKLIWYENLGSGNFSSEHIIDYSTPEPTKSISFMSNDDLVLGQHDLRLTVSIYHSINNTGGFDDGEVIYDVVKPFGAALNGGAFHAYTGDVTGDGHDEIVTHSFNRAETLVFVNDQNGGFDSPVTIDNTLRNADIILGDFAGNNLIDIIGVSYRYNVAMQVLDDKITLYENTTALSISENELNNLTIFPNPTNDIIHFANINKVKQIKIYNSFGQIVKENTNPTEKIISLKKLDKGIYMLHLEYGNKTIIKKIIKR